MTTTVPSAPDVLAQPDVLDQIVIWKMNDPKFTDRHNRVKGIAMQRQWTIEGRADYDDKEKNDAITRAFKEAAVHVHAVMALLADGQKPQVVCYSDDFYHGHEKITLHDDVLGAAISEHGDKMGGSGAVSNELLSAAAEAMDEQERQRKAGK